MEQLQNALAELLSATQKATKQINLTKLEAELVELTNQSQQPDFWSDSVHAQEVMKRQSVLKNRVEPWQKLHKAILDLQDLAALNDEGLLAELEQQYTTLKQDFDHLKDELKFSGPYDDHSVLLSIFAGAGGTDAQDWASILLRMYIRWAEKQQLTVRTLEQSAGDEAGLKSVTLEIDGMFAYGHLKGEHGVHRLVRLSPFNADNLRQTSFAKVDVLPKIDQPSELELDEKELKIDVFRSGGHGGQSVNTTDSAVRITHLPTNIVIVIQNERSQLQNKETAMTILRSRLAQLQLEQHQEKIAELKGPSTSAEWGNQIRSYVMHPYSMVKDLRTRYETSDVQGVLDGNLDAFIAAYLEFSIGKKIDE